jgi:sugar phosphate permease
MKLLNTAARRELVFAIFCFLFVLALFLRTSTAVIVEDLMRDFAVPAAALGLMASALFYSYSLVQIPVGMLSDRIGVRYTVVFSGLMGVAGTVLFALSTNIQMATWARLLTGIGTTCIWVPALKYLSVVYPPDKFATRTGIVSTVGSTGLLLATLPLAVLVERIGWRYSFILVGAVLLTAIIIAWSLMGGPQNGNAKTASEKIVAGNSTPKELSAQHSFFRHPTFWRFALWAFLVYGVQFSFQGLWGAAYLQNSFGLSRESAGSVLFFTSLGILLGGLSWGFVSDRFFRARRPVLYIGTVGMLISWTIMVMLTTYPGQFLTSLLYFCLGFFNIVFLVNFSCAKELFPPARAGTAIGVVNTFMLLSAGIYQSITGYMLDHFLVAGTFLTAYRAIYIFYLASITAAFFLLFIMPETFPQKTKAED